MASFSPEECWKLAELAEANCMADFYHAATPTFAEAHGLYCEHTDSYTAILAKDNDFSMLNRVYALGVARPITEEELDHLIDLYHQAHLSFRIRLSPHAQPPELLHWLEVRGFTPEQGSARFYIQPTEPINLLHPFDIRPVDFAEAANFARIAYLDRNPALQTWLLATIDRSGWHHYLAFLENTPIASGVLYTQEKFGWFGWAATLPAYRGKGAQQALIAHRINEAIRMGCSLISAETREETTEQPNPSYHNLLRLGFQMAYLRQHYQFDPD